MTTRPSDAPAALPGGAARSERRLDRVGLPPGARLGELELLRVLAVGGFGIVYLARDHSLDRDVAVKEFMPAQLVSRVRGHRVMARSAAHAEIFAAGLRSFIDEAKLLAGFSHPAMVKVYRILEANGTAYMVMPYLQGPTLSDVRRSMSEPPTEAWLLRVANPLLDALEMLHREGIYHRDISPENVLMADGAPVLLDFGAARRLIGDRTQSLTAILKPRYAPIEQYAEAEHLRQGPWTDLYALAALLACLLDGAPPPAATARALHDGMEPLVRRRIPGVSPAFLSAIDWALSVRPLDRPQSVAELRRALNPAPVLPAARRGHRPDAAGVPVVAVARPAGRIGRAVGRLVGRAAGRALGRVVGRPWQVAAGSVLVALAVAGPVVWPVSGPSAPAERVEPDSSGVTGATGATGAGSRPPGNEVKVGAAGPPEALGVGSDTRARAASRSVVAVPESSTPPAPAPAPATAPAPAPAPAVRRVATGHAAPPAGRSKPAAQARPSAPTAELAARQAGSSGPVEMCAGQNFFLRPYCVQQQCAAPRFSRDAYCLQLRQFAQNRRGQLP